MRPFLIYRPLNARIASRLNQTLPVSSVHYSNILDQGILVEIMNSN